MQLLDPSALLEQLPRLLPVEDGKQQAATSSLRSPHDALAALVHTIFARLAFRLTSLTDDPHDKSTQPSIVGNTLPSSWNAAGPGSYTFRYAHEQSSMTFLVKIVSLGARLLIHATALESNRTESYEVEVDRFTSRSFWPWPSAAAAASSSSSSTSTEPLVNGFVGSSRVADFAFGMQVKIVQKLVPGLRKDGYEEVAEGDQGSSSSTSAAAGGSRSSGRAQPQPARPQGGPGDDDDDDEYRRYPPMRDPLRVGDRDLDPLGRGGFGAPPPLFGGGPGRFPPIGGDDGGGMMVGPNHPMFRDRFQNPNGGNFGPGGGIVPPGARFDPVTPFGVGPNRPGGSGPLGPFGPGGGRAPNRPGMGDPDWDDMPPPGNNNNDYDNMFM